jgi:hypothetical protein
LLLSACTVKFFYNRLDWLIPWYISDYVDLTSEQDDVLERRVAEQLRWHRTSELPAYSSSLYRTVGQMQDGLDRRELDAIYTETEAYWRRLADRLAPEVASLLMMISDEQSEDLLKNLAEKNREFQDEHVDPPEQEQRRERRKLVEKQAKRWLDFLNDAQEEAIFDWSSRYRLTSAATLRSRRAWQNELRELMSRRRDNPHFAEQLRELLMYPERGWSEDYRRDLEFNRELSKDLILALDRHASQKQRDFLIGKLNVMAYDFAQLAQTD